MLGALSLPLEVQNFIVSCSASAIGATAVYPIDVVKTRLQNQNKLKATAGPNANAPVIYRGTWDCFKTIVRTEGALRLYSGLIANLSGQVPEKAIRLFVVDRVRSSSLFRYDTNKGKLGPFSLTTKQNQLASEIAAGVAAGTCQVFITNPSEVIKVRMQVAAHAKPSLASIFKEVGVKGMYRGASACFLRDIPFSGIYFPLYYVSKDVLQVSSDKSVLMTSSSSFRLFFSASVAGMVAAGVTTPADVIKTRLQAQKTTQYKGLWDCYKQIVKTEGYSSLFKGVLPRILRSSPQYGVMLMSYELLQRYLVHVPSSLVEPISNIVEDRWQVMNSWQPPKSFDNGTIKKISIGGMGNVWGLDAANNVCKWTGFSWKRLDGVSLDYISVGADGTVCGVKNNVAVRLDPWNLTFYPLAPSPVGVRLISVGHGAKIWGVGLDKYPYKYRIDGRWKKRGTRKIFRMSVGADGGVWAIEDSTGAILQWQSKINDWKVMPSPEGCGSLTLVNACSTTKAMVLDSNHRAWSFSASSNGSSPWSFVPTDDNASVWVPVTEESAMEFSTLLKIDQDLTKLLFDKMDKILGG